MMLTDPRANPTMNFMITRTELEHTERRAVFSFSLEGVA